MAVTLKGPPEITGVSIMGQHVEVIDGVVTVDDTAALNLIPFGFERYEPPAETTTEPPAAAGKKGKAPDPAPVPAEPPAAAIETQPA